MQTVFFAQYEKSLKNYANYSAGANPTSSMASENQKIFNLRSAARYELKVFANTKKNGQIDWFWTKAQ